MRKTIYSVDYAIFGSDRVHTRWFETLEAAKEFAKNEYTSDVSVHNFGLEKANKIMNKQKAIDEIEM